MEGGTDTETDMTKLIAAFRNFTNASKSGWSTPTNSSLLKKKKKKKKKKQEKKRKKQKKKRIF